jgi:hypothetical protein
LQRLSFIPRSDQAGLSFVLHALFRYILQLKTKLAEESAMQDIDISFQTFNTDKTNKIKRSPDSNELVDVVNGNEFVPLLKSMLDVRFKPENYKNRDEYYSAIATFILNNFKRAGKRVGDFIDLSNDNDKIFEAADMKQYDEHRQNFYKKNYPQNKFDLHQSLAASLFIELAECNAEIASYNKDEKRVDEQLFKKWKSFYEKFGLTKEQFEEGFSQTYFEELKKKERPPS